MGSIVIVAIVVLATAAFVLKQQPSGPPPNEPAQYGVVMGRISGINGNPVSGVNVRSGTATVVANDGGWFAITNVTTAARVLVTFSKAGYVSTQRATQVRSLDSSFMEVVMVQASLPQTLDATLGGSITDGVGRVTIAANSLVDAQGNPFTGTAEVSLTTFDPTVDSTRDSFPGDFAGLVGGEERPFESFGYLDVAVTGGGPLQLATGSMATLDIPIPPSEIARAPDTIDLWYYDLSDGFWKRDGTATKAGDVYTGAVEHFSYWNADRAYDKFNLKGLVVTTGVRGVSGAGRGGEESPLPGALVLCDGLDYSGRSRGYSDDNGRFSVPVRIASTVVCIAAKGGRMSDPITEVTPATVDGQRDIGRLALADPYAQVILSWGANPSDLDNHLTGRKADGQTIHIYYADEGSFATEPYALLDTDDMNGYGPEIISIGRFATGTYRQSVRHYGGEGSIATSGAEVTVVIQGVGIYRFTPPAGQLEGTDVWRIFDLVVSSSGTVSAVNPINDYVTGGDHSELMYP